MLFSYFKIVSFVAIAIAALAIPATNAKNAKDGIELVQHWKPAQPGASEKVHMITFVGDSKKYQIKGEEYAKGKASNASCDAKAGKGKLMMKSPCSVSAKEHDQFFTISCAKGKRKNFARVLFSAASGQIEVNTHGKIWAGFTSDPDGQKLRSTEFTMQALIAKGDDVGVIFSCINNKRDK